jgi:hypothetical protein
MVKRPSVFELAWAAGLFEGEGSLGIQGVTPQIRVAMTDFDVVEAWGAMFGLGPVREKKVPLPHKRQWVVTAQGEDALAIMSMLEPWLYGRRLERLAEVRAIREEKMGARPCEVCRETYQPYRTPPSGRYICSERCRDSLRVRTPVVSPGQLLLVNE